MRCRSDWPVAMSDSPPPALLTGCLVVGVSHLCYSLIGQVGNVEFEKRQVERMRLKNWSLGNAAVIKLQWLQQTTLFTLTCSFRVFRVDELECAQTPSYSR